MGECRRSADYSHTLHFKTVVRTRKSQEEGLSRLLLQKFLYIRNSVQSIGLQIIQRMIVLRNASFSTIYLPLVCAQDDVFSIIPQHRKLLTSSALQHSKILV